MVAGTGDRPAAGSGHGARRRGPAGRTSGPKVAAEAAAEVAPVAAERARRRVERPGRCSRSRPRSGTSSRCSVSRAGSHAGHRCGRPAGGLAEQVGATGGGQPARSASSSTARPVGHRAGPRDSSTWRPGPGVARADLGRGRAGRMGGAHGRSGSAEWRDRGSAGRGPARTARRAPCPPTTISPSMPRISARATPRPGSPAATSPTDTRRSRLGRLYAALDHGRPWTRQAARSSGVSGRH